MMKNFKRAISSFFTAAFAVIYMALNATTAFAAMIDERPKTDDEVTAEALYVHTDNPEADAVFNAYVDVAVKMVGTDYYENGKSYITVSSFKTNCGGTKEQFDQLRHNVAPIEQFLWMTTYTEPCMVLEHLEWCLDTWESFESWAEKEVGGSKLAFILREAPDKEEQMDAYKTMLKWQYDYYTVNKSFYCFFTGQGLWLVDSKNDYSSYFGGESTQTTPTSTDVSGNSESMNTITTTSTSKLVPLTTTVSTTGIWEETGEKLAKTWLTIGIILVLLLALAIVVIVKKRKGY